jgi:hypothetical protein
MLLLLCCLIVFFYSHIASSKLSNFFWPFLPSNIIKQVLSCNRRSKIFIHSNCMFGEWMSHPYFGQVWGWSPTLGKVRSWSPLGLPNVQNSTARGKTPRIGVFLVSLERSWSVNIENGLALIIWTSVAQVMGKRRARSQTGIWLPTTKSRELTFSRHPIWECEMELERSRRGLQLWSRPHCDRMRESRVMSSQSPGTPTGTISGQFWDSNLGVPGICAIWM